MRASIRGPRWPRLAAMAVAAGLAATVLSPVEADAAGMTTHGWMAVEAIDEVGDPGLQELLETHQEQVRSGAMFPDIGYLSPNTYGEEAHWQRFVDAYVDLIAARTDCGPDLSDPDGPCADMIAHAFGIAAHGMGDEVWDWLFEPNGPDRDEYYTNGLPTANEGGAETQMDLVAVGVHGVPRPVIPPIPDVPTVLQAFTDSGFSGVTEAQFAAVPLAGVVWDVETQWASEHLAGVLAAMPWMSANMVTAPGGVDFAATAIAGYWDSLWGRLHGAQPATEVSITYPATNQSDIPSTGWVRSYQPGSGRGRGGAQTRITAALTYSRPYAPPGGSGVPATMAAGTMTVTDVATGTALPIMSGYPRSVPYGGDAGQHLIDVQPATDLAACSWYEVAVGVTTPVLDARGLPVEPYTWRFRTACGPNRLHGTVDAPDGVPVAGGLVLPYRATDGFLPVAYAVVEADGSYEITDMPDGEYQLAFVPPAGAGLQLQWLGNTSARGAADWVTLPRADAAIDFTFETASVISGTVTDSSSAPLPGILVVAFTPTGNWVPNAQATTGPDGSYRLDSLPAGDYHVGFHSPARGGLRWWQSGSTNRADVTVVTLTDSDQTDIDFTYPS